MLQSRVSGILLHPTSLPGKFGIGDLGEPAFRFADFLQQSGQQLWQVLPLGPTGYGHSPYQSLSSMAGNPLLISLEGLVQDGWLSEADLAQAPRFPADRVDYGAVAPFKWDLLRKAARNFSAAPAHPLRPEFERFCAEKNAWLQGFAEFAALKDAKGGARWTEWPPGLKPDPERVRLHKFMQFVFFRQWRRLWQYCRERSIRVMGDIPIFVDHDSADVWANPALFDLDAAGLPRSVAGVPPDYFSETGQLWGNPLYRWEVMEQTGYQWWVDRVRGMLDQVDWIRLDHFRGFEKYYRIPAEARTAVEGTWVEGPGNRFFSSLEQALGRLPFIAEDLGYITPEVHALRDRWGFPGMRVLQFAFGNQHPDDPFKPHNFIRNCVVYTGTHDNDTTVGWLHGGIRDTTISAEQARAEREFALRYLNSDGREIHWDFIRAAIASVARVAVYPLQDVLGLGSEARMNTPAQPDGNWGWRFRQDRLTAEVATRLRELARTYGRLRT
ncbi:MAG: 4-alpha-glucanotransferase [Acidobacteriota bacterium]